MTASCERLVRNDSRRMLKKLFVDNRFAQRGVSTDPREGPRVRIAFQTILA